jgi:dTDP-4-amino-4,6-dideoxygalactose transaminase
LKSYLESVKIPAMIYYPVPLHVQEAYKYLGYNENEFPVTTSLSKEVLSLPIHPDFDQEQLDHIVKNIFEFFEKK